MSGQILNFTNSSAFASNQLSFLSTLMATNTTMQIKPYTFDGVTTGLYPFTLNVMEIPPGTILSKSIYYWNSGSSVSLKAALSTINILATSSQISYN